MDGRRLGFLAGEAFFRFWEGLVVFRDRDSFAALSFQFSAFVADFGGPALEGHGFGRRKRLGDPDEGFGVGGFDFPLFPIGCDHSYWGTICPRVGIQLGIAFSEFFDANRAGLRKEVLAHRFAGAAGRLLEPGQPETGGGLDGLVE